MKFWRRYWYLIGGVLFVILAFFMGLWGSEHYFNIQLDGNACSSARGICFSWRYAFNH